MKELITTDGSTILLDDSWYEMLSYVNWQTDVNGYAIRHTYTKGKFKREFMHRIILDILDRNIKVDHVDRNIKNNTMANLRKANMAQNSMNRELQSNSTSGFKGVSFYKRDSNYSAHITLDGIKKHLGYFKTKEEAAQAYNKKALELFGEYACINKIGGEE